jgi:hypothetical protein
MNEQEIIHQLEKHFNFLSNIYFDKMGHNGDLLFSCIDIDKEAILVVDKDGYVMTKVKGKKFYDVLGSIKL